MSCSCPGGHIGDHAASCRLSEERQGGESGCGNLLGCGCLILLGLVILMFVSGAVSIDWKAFD